MTDVVNFCPKCRSTSKPQHEVKASVVVAKPHIRIEYVPVLCDACLGAMKAIGVTSKEGY